MCGFLPSLPLLHPQTPGTAPALDPRVSGGSGDVPARGPWDGWHRDTQGCMCWGFPRDLVAPASLGGAAAGMGSERCPRSPSLPAPSRGHPSSWSQLLPAPVIYREGNRGQQPRGDLEKSKQSHLDLKKSGKGVPGGIVADGDGEGVLQPQGSGSHHAGVHPETGDYTSRGERLEDWKNCPAVKAVERFAGTF